MKKTYMNPEMVVVPLMAQQMIAYSVTSVSGLDGVTIGDGDFTGGASDVKAFENLDGGILDEEW